MEVNTSVFKQIYGYTLRHMASLRNTSYSRVTAMTSSQIHNSNGSLQVISASLYENSTREDGKG